MWSAKSAPFRSSSLSSSPTSPTWNYDNVKGFDPIAGGTVYCLLFFPKEQAFSAINVGLSRFIVFVIFMLDLWPEAVALGVDQNGSGILKVTTVDSSFSTNKIFWIQNASYFTEDVTLASPARLGMTTIAMKLLLWEWASDVNCCMTYCNLCRLKTPWVVRLKIPTTISEFSLLTPLFRPANVEDNHGWRRASNFPDTSTSAVGPPEFEVEHNKWRETKLFWQQSKYFRLYDSTSDIHYLILIYIM